MAKDESSKGITEVTRGFWDQTAHDYDEARDLYARERYPESVYRFRRVSEMAKAAAAARGGAANLKCLDIGCGAGEMLERLVQMGVPAANLTGVDYSPQMVEKARTRLAARGLGDIALAPADATKLSDIPDGSLDVVLSIQVYGYISRELEAGYYGEANRVLRPGGFLITAEANCLFDLFTLNRFTVGFHRENFLAHGFQNDQLAAVSQRLAGLLTKPELPPRPAVVEAGANYVASLLQDAGTKYTSHREQTFTKRENPMVYGKQLQQHGFRLNDLAFYHFHACPPLFFYEQPELERVAEKLEDSLCREWQGNFMASSFVALLQKQ
jgi:ubiquinone/menaquinone biosynthesis C-methylase UbiE